MILVNILALVALASSLVMLMISAQDFSGQRSLLYREASQAAIIARSGETSAAIALRRDAVDAPEADHMREAWATVIEDEARIVGGTFTLSVIDAQAKFNLNNLAAGGLAAAGAVPIIAEALQVEIGEAEALVAALQAGEPLTDLSQLRGLGVDDATLIRMSEFVTLLPGPTALNINTAAEPIVLLVVRDPISARRLIEQRARAGFVTREDLAVLGISLPPGVGFKSQHFWVRTSVRIGETSQTLTSLIARVADEGGATTRTLRRSWGSAAPPAEGAVNPPAR